MKIIVINGPNLHLLGMREPSYYGNTSLNMIEQRLKEISYKLDPTVFLEFFQSNSEGAIVDKISEIFFLGYDGIIINPAAYSHTSIAILDALRGVGIPAIEVHISNIYTRESYRHHSYVSEACIGQISGLGVKGYEYALYAMIEHIKNKRS